MELALILSVIIGFTISALKNNKKAAAKINDFSSFLTALLIILLPKLPLRIIAYTGV